MTVDLCKLPGSKSVAEAVKIMAEKSISSVIVVTDEKPVGIMTQRDIFTKILAKGKDPQRVKIEDAMSSPPICVPPSFSVHSASRTMEELKIRRLLVMEGEKLFGIVSQTDIFAAIGNKLQSEEDVCLRDNDGRPL